MMTPTDKARFEAERHILVDQIHNMLWDSDVFREISMNMTPAPGTCGLDPTDAQMDAYVNACSEIQAEQIGVVLIDLLKKNNNFA